MVIFQYSLIDFHISQWVSVWISPCRVVKNWKSWIFYMKKEVVSIETQQISSSFPIKSFSFSIISLQNLVYDVSTFSNALWTWNRCLCSAAVQWIFVHFGVFIYFGVHELHKFSGKIPNNSQWLRINVAFPVFIYGFSHCLMIFSLNFLI